MNLLVNEDERVAAWAQDRLKAPLLFTAYRAFGVADDDGELRGAMLFHDYNGSNIEITIYGPGCVKRALIRYAFDYAFHVNGAARLTARTRRGNARMRKMLPKMGFVYEGTSKNYYGPNRGDDALNYALFPPAAARWMGSHS